MHQGERTIGSDLMQSLCNIFSSVENGLELLHGRGKLLGALVAVRPHLPEGLLLELERSCRQSCDSHRGRP